MEKKTKFEKLWGSAHNLCSAYDNLRQMRELFDEAKSAEEAVSSMEKSKQTLTDEIKALDKAKEELRVRYAGDAEKIKDQTEKAQQDLEAMKVKYIEKYEAGHGKLVKRAEEELVSMGDKKGKLKESIEAKLTYIRELDKRIQMKEGQIEAFEDQFKQIQKALT